MKIGAAQACLSSVLICFFGCQEQSSLLTGPTALGFGIIVYEHADYTGESGHITRDIADLRDFEGPCLHFRSDTYGPTTDENWNDCISSVRVAPGWRAVLYRDKDFRGEQLEVTADVPNLRHEPGNCDDVGFNDCISSVRLVRQ
jgi:hypothetical protein